MARAYAGAAKAAVEAAPLQDFKHQAQATFKASFERTSDLERLLSAAHVTDRRYTQDGIELDISDDEETVEALSTQWERENY